MHPLKIQKKFDTLLEDKGKFFFIFIKTNKI